MINPCKNQESFLAPFRFQVSLETTAALIQPLILNIIYVGCAENPNYDQVLQTIEFPVDKKGPYTFDIVTDQIDPNQIPSIDDLLGVSLIFISVLYKSQEFYRCSFLVNNDYNETAYQSQNSNFDINLVNRRVMVDNPRELFYDVDWDDQQDLFLQEKMTFFDEQEIENTKNNLSNLMNNYEQELKMSSTSFLGKFANK